MEEIICKDFFTSDINQVLPCKSELQSLFEDKGVAGWRTANAQLSIFF